jgi:D-serine deaminase-like pyridoxal phosphate-dependent protein
MEGYLSYLRSKCKARNQDDFPDHGWGRPSYGSVHGRPDLWLGKISAETAAVQYTDPDMTPGKRLRIGERLEIIPNNATLAISMQARIYGVRNGMIERVFAVAGRGGTPQLRNRVEV